MNSFFKRSAVLVLVVSMLATGCKGREAVDVLEQSSVSSDAVSSEEGSGGGESGDVSETESTGTSSDGNASGSSSPDTDSSGNDDSSASSSGNSGSSDPLDIGDTSGSSNSGGSNDGSSNGGSSNDGSSNGGSSNSGSSNDGSSNSGSSNNGSSNGGNSNGGSTVQTNTKPSGNITNGVKFDWSTDNSWEEEGGNKCGSVNFKVTNDSGRAVSSWKITFTVPNGFKITNGWNGTYSINGTTATVTNAEYNGEVPAGGTISLGFNYSSPTAFKTPSDVTFNGTPAGSSGNNGGQNNNNGGGNNGGQSGGDKNQNDPVPSEDILKLIERSDKAVQGDDWLHTDGNRILDKNGKQVWLTGVNWFGYNTGTNTFDGLWNSQMRGTVKAIADHGFNLIRVPISAELLNQWSRGEYPKANYNNASNPEMNDMNSLQIFDYFLKLAEENGMKVMPDIHCAETNAMGHNVNLWYTDKVSVEDYYHALEWLADRYKDNDTIIAIDIKNEPHGKPNEGSNAAIWNNSTAANNWKYTAEQAAARILAKNPNLLIMVEGTEIYSKNNGSYSSQNSADYYFNWWGGNLRGVRDYPVNLGKYQNKLVYSPHDYGPTVYEQPWFEGGFDYNSLIRDCWQDNWLYIQKENIAPLLIGEWGGFMKEPNLKWMTCMRKLIGEYHLNHTFWCYNANSGDTGGLVLDDFNTWDTEKYNFVKEVLWQEGGKFVGLDHAIPLGANGITLTSAKGLN